MDAEENGLEQGVVANLRYDMPAGLVVFLVALPLCLGIALASDAPLLSGIVSGVVAGLVVGPLSGSQLAVSGPAAGLTTIVAAGIATLGSFEAFLAAVVLCGAIQLALGLLRAGGVAAFFPVSVIKGMLAAIGIILILKQIPHALGRDADYEGDLGFWFHEASGHGQSNTFTELYAAVVTLSPGAVVLSVVGLALMILWEQPFLKRQAWTRWAPGALMAVLSGIVLNGLFSQIAPSWEVTAVDGHLVQIPAMQSFGALSAQMVFPDLTRIWDPVVLELGVTLAIIASVETLLSLEATDKLDPFRRVSDPSRELVAQGIGNLVAGFVGGLPMTAVIVRSSTNVYAGGRTRVAAFIHGLLLVGMVLAVPFLLNRIPLASLAAVLLVVGWKLARPELFRAMWNGGLDQFLPFIVTIVVTVLTDLLAGVAAGLVLGLLMTLISNNVSAVSMVHEDNAYLVRFSSNVSFLNKARLKTTLASIPDGAEVLIDGRNADFIDRDIYDVIEDFKANARFRNIRVSERALASKAFPLLGRRNDER